MSATNPTQVTYLGRRAQVWEYRTAGPASERTVFVRWIDDAHERSGGYPAGTVTAKVVKGNFKKGTGEVLVPTYVVEGA